MVPFVVANDGLKITLIEGLSPSWLEIYVIIDLLKSCSTRVALSSAVEVVCLSMNPRSDIYQLRNFGWVI